MLPPIWLIRRACRREMAWCRRQRLRRLPAGLVTLSGMGGGCQYKEDGPRSVRSAPTANRYSSYMPDVSMSHTIRPGLETVASFDARPFTYVGPAALNRTFYAARIGLTFSPRPLPIVLR